MYIYKDSMEIRLISIKKELQDQKKKLSALEATRLISIEKELEAQKNQLSILETNRNSKFHDIQNDVNFLKIVLPTVAAASIRERHRQ